MIHTSGYQAAPPIQAVVVLHSACPAQVRSSITWMLQKKEQRVLFPSAFQSFLTLVLVYQTSWTELRISESEGTTPPNKTARRDTDRFGVPIRGKSELVTNRQHRLPAGNHARRIGVAVLHSEVLPGSFAARIFQLVHVLAVGRAGARDIGDSSTVARRARAQERSRGHSAASLAILVEQIMEEVVNISNGR